MAKNHGLLPVESKSEDEIDNQDLAFLLHQTLQYISQITEKDEIKARIDLALFYLNRVIGDKEFKEINEGYDMLKNSDISHLYISTKQSK